MGNLSSNKISSNKVNPGDVWQKPFFPGIHVLKITKDKNGSFPFREEVLRTIEEAVQQFDGITSSRDVEDIGVSYTPSLVILFNGVSFCEVYLFEVDGQKSVEFNGTRSNRREFFYRFFDKVSKIIVDDCAFFAFSNRIHKPVRKNEAWGYSDIIFGTFTGILPKRETQKESSDDELTKCPPPSLTYSSSIRMK